jgi:hypothetical protein
VLLEQFKARAAAPNSEVHRFKTKSDALRFIVALVLNKIQSEENGVNNKASVAIGDDK